MEQTHRISQALMNEAASLTLRRTFVAQLKTHPVITLVKGERGVGKTTGILQFLHNQAKEGRKVLYLSADSIFLQDKKLFDHAEAFASEGGEILAIDEIHKANNWSAELKTIYDCLPQLRMIASGSATLPLQKADLSRRAIPFDVHGMSFREWCLFEHQVTLPQVTLEELLSNHTKISIEAINKLAEQKLSRSVLFSEYLRTGYYPTGLGLKEEALYSQILQQTVNTAIQQDILTNYPELKGTAIEKMRRLLKIIAGKTPYSPNLKELKECLDIGDESSLKQYLYYLHETATIRLLLPPSKAIRSLTKPEKIYLSNSNLLFALSNSSPNLGTVRETFAAQALAIEHALNRREEVRAAKTGDLLSDTGHTFEVGGKNKTRRQLQGLSDGIVIADDIDHGEKGRIPLWLFGLLW
jgi:uncharacterized protein